MKALPLLFFFQTEFKELSTDAVGGTGKRLSLLGVLCYLSVIWFRDISERGPVELGLPV